MSCIITYKGQKYSEEQFKEYFINNKQEFVTSISKNKDVIDSFKRKMEGINVNLYSQYLEQNPNGSVEQFKSWVDNNQTNVQYQKQIDLQAEQDAVLEEFANSLSERFNISFDLISEKEAKSMSPKYINEPAFFDPKTKKAYLVKGKANKTSAIHEIFTHPFLLQIEKTNPTLYKNLLKEAKNNKSIVDYVDNHYGTNQNNDHEYIARAIDLAVQGELDQQKDKTLLGRIQDFFNQLSDYLKKLFNVPKVFSSAISPNITLQQLTQFAMYGKGKMNLNPAQENIEYSLKATNVILKNLDKIKQWEKNKSISEDVLWNKIQELGVPKEQLELIKNSEGNTVEEKSLDFANQYSYTVEINTAKTNINSGGAAVQELDDLYIPQLRETFYFSYRDGWFKEDSKQDRIIATPEELKIIEEYKNKDATRNSSFYLSLSVPGDTEWKNKYENNPDWEYQELEFHTPDITLSIKGHALFSTDNGIGWVRVWYNKKTGAVEIQEIQSDLFQKGRDSKLLTGEYSKFPIGAKVKYKNNIYTIDNKYDGDIFKLYDLKNEDGIIRGIKANEFTDIVESAGSNQFLQLLNKNNNWVTFFVKSIIQDSAKKGYEKVLFPTGNTASKVEGHTTLEEFKKQKEDRIKDLEIRISKFNKAINNPTDFYDKETQGYLIRGMGLTHFDEESFIEIVKEKKEKYGNEVTQIKQELERVEGPEGFGALKPIYNFYENTVTNILNKTYGKIQDFSNTFIKTGVDNIFEENKELSKIGSKQLYSAYLDTIFPDSKVKDIYTNNADVKIEKYDKKYIGQTDAGESGQGFYFKPITENSGYFKAAYGDVANYALLNISNNIERTDKNISDIYGMRLFEIKENLKDNSVDGVIRKQYQSEKIFEQVVFEPEQIHILGNKQDIEGFKEFVKESSKPKVPQITDEYGNTWNEVRIDKNRDNQNIVFQKTPQSNAFSQFQQSLNKPNTNPILQGNQQEQIKKFAELQERLNNKEFIEGAKNAFESSEELQNVYYEAVRFNKTLEFYEGDNLKIDDKTYTISEKISSKELAKRNGLTISSNIPVYIVNEPLGLRKGGYDTVNNIIILSKNSDKETIHHELIHSVEYNLDKKEIEPLYQKVKNTITEDSFNDFVSWNFKKSISEFIADALSKKVFRDALKKEGLLEEIDNTLSVYSQQLSPQQKQDALNAYTDYIARVSLGILKNPSSGGYNYTSQAKDIVYHGTDKEFTEFVKGKEIIPKGKTKGGIWFTDFDNADWVYKEEGGKVVAALINLKNPIEYSTDRFFDEQYGDNLPTKPLKEGQWKDVQKLLDNKNGDGLLLDIFDATTAGDIGEFTKQQVVFEPEQIHILGSKQDIEGFKDFVQGKQDFDKELAQKIQDKLQKLYPEIKLNITNNPVWEQGDNIFNQEEYINQVNYRLKVVSALLKLSIPQETKRTRKYGETTKPGRLTIKLNSKEKPYIEINLRKTLRGKGVTDNQIDFIFDYMKSNGIQEISTEQLALELASKYGYSVEVNTAKEKLQSPSDIYNFNLDGNSYSMSYYQGVEDDYTTYFKNNKEISYEEYDKAQDEYLKIFKESTPTQHYSNLTVPGGTNYTEQELSTPLITPSIKGHAQFATSNGIGWFRSDEQTVNGTFSKETKLDDINIEDVPNNFTLGETTFYLENGDWMMQSDDSPTRMREVGLGEAEVLIAYKSKLSGLTEIDNNLTGENFRVQNNTFGTPTKTRRILEIQSDLFQKGRDKKDLTGIDIDYEIAQQYGEDAVAEITNEYRKKYDTSDTKENQFLQLLNKNSNWVTFFVKSIIQDSAKKGYEKVLFPKGETAAKIEGHETIAEQIRKVDIEIESIKKGRLGFDKTELGKEKEIKTGQKIEEVLFAQRPESNRVKEFEQKGYITNIRIDIDIVKLENKEQERNNLKSQGIEKLRPIEAFYEIKVGNILEKLFGKDNVKTITDEYGNQWFEITINQARDLQNILLQRNEADKIIGQANIKARTVLVDAIKQKQDTLPHEYAHHYIAWFRNTPIVQEAIKKWGSEEALVQSIGEQVVKQKGEAYNWWNNFVKWIMNQFNSLSKLQKEELTQILTDAFLTRQDLGSKQDIEGFKNWVDNSEIQYSKTNNNTEQQTPEDLLTKMIDSGAIQKDCTGGFKAKDGIRGKFTKGSQWEIAKDLKGYPSHAQGGVDIKLGKDGFSFTGKDGIIKAKYGLVLPVIKAQSGVVVNNDDKNKSKYRPSIGDKVGDNYITDNNIVNKFKRYLTESSITDNPSEFLKNVASKKNPFGYYRGLPFSTAAKAGKWKIDRNDKEGYYSLYNYNPFGDSFYDRVYDKDIKKYDYDENTKKEIQKHYKSGAIKPVIDYEKNELGWEYNDYSKLQDKTIKDKKFVQDWFNNPEAKKRYIKSGGTEEQWKENIDNINKNLSTLKIKESLKIPDLYTGEEALYSPYYHSVLDHFENAYTHEITHGSHAAKNKHSSSIIKDVVKNHSLRKDSYYQSDEEVYSRIMQIRKDFDIKPSDKIDKEYLKQKLLEQKSKYKDIDELFRYIDSKGIIKLLNSLADNSNKSTNNNLV